MDALQCVADVALGVATFLEGGLSPKLAIRQDLHLALAGLLQHQAEANSVLVAVAAFEILVRVRISCQGGEARSQATGSQSPAKSGLHQ